MNAELLEFEERCARPLDELVNALKSDGCVRQENRKNGKRVALLLCFCLSPVSN